ncbi:ImmA/IrrE family metallo-endopeptidase [Arthrobacter sp. ISL-28]|uniref:helix-turn-helix domain-containing protein n=1 Tax=Arthrobacter sp. ISL-28 TaxID=2819108 RepID=UPI001BE7CDDD|nr:XRE family transcriptional regulator [Arthrobacter sp. ISL-28]MBT2520916.1 ImmA/IrrE family metallo-endopeptidase [Arthrobacter sp. ISL-28]
MKDSSGRQLQLFSDDVLLSARAVHDDFEPRRLGQARRLAGLTKQALGEAVGVSGASIGQYEAAVTVPGPNVIAALARELGMPVAFFTPGRPIGQIDASQAHFRSLRSTRSSEKLKAATYAEWVWELSLALEKRVLLPEPNVPSLDDSSESMTPAEAAMALRDYWELGTGPLRHLTLTMEHNGILVTCPSFDHDGQAPVRVDAFSTSALERPIVVTTLERAKSVYRHRFTCAHELGHLVLHRDVVPGDPRQEREADAFAAELLTPRAEIEPLLPSTMNLARLGRVGLEWGVSTESLIRRMQEVKGIADVSVRRAYQKIREQNRLGTRQDPTTADSSGEQPSLLREAMSVAEQNGFSTVDLANELRWPIQRVRELLGIQETRPRLRLVHG